MYVSDSGNFLGALIGIPSDYVADGAQEPIASTSVGITVPK